MEEAGQMAQVKDAAVLEKHLKLWKGERLGRVVLTPPRRDETPRPTHNFPIGYILSLEGADSIVTIRHLERAYEQGLRAIGPAHYGPGVYANGTDATGGVQPQGRGRR